MKWEYISLLRNIFEILTHDMELFGWQKKCLNNWKENNYRGIVSVITGAGKTILALAGAYQLLQKYPDMHISIVVPTIHLANQWKDEIGKYFENTEFTFISDDVGQLGGSHLDNPERQIMIYIINSARDAISSHIKNTMRQGRKLLLIADECHHYGSEHNRRIFTAVNDNVFTIGLSATPYCQNFETVLVPALGKEIYHYGFDQALDEGRISPFRILQIAVPFNENERLAYAEISESIIFLYGRLIHEYPFLKASLEDGSFFPQVQRLSALEDGEGTASSYINTIYARRHLTQMAESRKQCVSALLERIKSKTPVLLFCERIEQADDLYAYIQQIKPDQVTRYHSNMTTEARKMALEEFRTRRSNILITCKALDEGIDVPDVSIGIVVSSTQTARQHIQRMG